MAMTPSQSSKQASLCLRLTKQNAETVSVSMGDNILFRFTPTQNYFHLALSIPKLAKNKEVTISPGGTIIVESLNGFVKEPEAEESSALSYYTLTRNVTTLDPDGSM